MHVTNIIYNNICHTYNKTCLCNFINIIIRICWMVVWQHCCFSDWTPNLTILWLAGNFSMF